MTKKFRVRRSLAGGLLLAFFGFALPLAALPATNYNKLYSKDAGSPLDGRLRPSGIPGLEQAYLPAIAASSHAANLIVLKDGTTLCFWFTGSWEGNSGVGIAFSRLPRGARQWSHPVLIDHRAGASFQNPVPFQAPNGVLWLVHSTQPAGKGEVNSQVLVLKSQDDGKTWSAPKVLFGKAGAFPRDPIVIRPDGAWLLPMYYTHSAGSVSSASSHPVIKLSRDEGKTWSDCPIPHASGLVQPSVVKLSDHRYVAFLRSRAADWIYRSASSDGCHWAAPTPTKLPNNNSSIQAAVLKDGNLVLVFNDSGPVTINGKRSAGPRKPLTVALSDDGGQSWKWMRDLERGRPNATVQLEKEKRPGREAYSYPSVVQMPDGKIGVAYTYRRETIKFVTFSEDWIKQGSQK